MAEGPTGGTRTNSGTRIATRVRKDYGLEAAQVMLGHSQANVTQVYAERDMGLAAAVAAKIG